MNKFWQWLCWFFRHGRRGTLLLNMRPGDEVVSMIQHREWLAIATKRGELYLLDADDLLIYQQ